MVRVLVAVDGSESADVAFRAACDLIKGDQDSLILVHVVGDLSRQYVLSALPEYTAAIPFPTEGAQKSLNAQGKAILDKYVQRAKGMRIKNVQALLGVSTHEGEFVCRLAKNRDIDLIVLGRRGLNSFSRLFMGSTSKYVMENAECNVCIVKKEFKHETKAPEQKEKIPALSQAEVQAQAKVLPERKLEEGAVFPPAAEAEGLEHRRRASEEKELLQHNTGHTPEEEEERKRRVKEQGLKDARAFHAELYDLSQP